MEVGTGYCESPALSPHWKPLEHKCVLKDKSLARQINLQGKFNIKEKKNKNKKTRSGHSSMLVKFSPKK